MYYEEYQSKTYYRKYKGVKKPVKKINLEMESRFDDGDDVIVMFKEDFLKLKDNVSHEDVDVDELIKTRDNLQHQLDIMDNMPQMMELISNHKDEINQLHQSYKDELSDKDDELKKEIKKSNLYLIVINDLIKRGLWDRINNNIPQSYYNVTGEEIDGADLISISSRDNSDDSDAD